MKPRPARRPGSALLEALLLASLLALGLLAVTGLQQRMAADVREAGRLAEAAQIAASVLDHLRSQTEAAALQFAVEAPGSLLGALAPASAPHSLELALGARAPLHTLRLSLAWPDGAGSSTRLHVDSLIAEAAPAWIGGPAAAPLDWLAPDGVQRLGLGGSMASAPGLALAPGELLLALDGEHWVADAADGSLRQRCNAAGACVDVNARLLGGHLLGAGAAAVERLDLVATEGLQADVDLDPGPGLARDGQFCRLAPMGYGDPAWPEGSRGYLCLLLLREAPGAVPAWGGRLQLQAASAPAGSVACRLLVTLAPSFDASASPPRYRGETGSLSRQHLLLRPGEPCPPGSARHQVLP